MEYNFEVDKSNENITVNADTTSAVKEEEDNLNKKFNPEDYVIMMQIGQGNFSELFLVEHKITKILYTEKMFTKMRVEQLKKQEDILMEKHVMEKISEHINIIKYYGSHKDNFYLYILYEYVNGGELWKKSIIYGLPSEKLVKFYFLQLLDGISHMHRFNIVHRDIKPENIMITKDELTVKIIDFGSCKDMDGTEFEKKFDLERQKQKSKKPTYKNFVGTPNYMAPECVRNKNSDFKSDMWSIGCLLYQMFTGFPPFLGKSDYLIFQKSTMAKYSSPENVIPSDAIDLISKLIVVDPSMRLTMSEVYNHAFLINENQDENFRKIYPQFTELENVLVKIKNDLKKKYSIFKSISSKLDRIKNYEIMEEDCKKNGVDEEPNNPLTKDDKQLIIEKPNLLEKYDSGLKQLKSDIQQIKNFILSHNKISLRENIHQYDLSNSDENEKKNLLDKINFFEKQILHDLFNLDYEGEL